MSKQHVLDTQKALTERVAAAMEANPGQWHKPWRQSLATTPHNVTTGKPYQGGNALWFAFAGAAYGDARWASYKQWASLGAQVRKGEKSTWGIYWKPWEKRDGAGEVVQRGLTPFAFCVFNAGQVDGAPELPAPEPGPDPIDRAEHWFDAVGAHVTHGAGGAYYSIGSDSINLPPLRDFVTADAYYATSAHEHVHWTGHRSRLGRLEKHTGFGTEEYAFEELVAELGAVFVSAHLGLDYESRLDTDHAAYLASWLKKFKGDHTYLWKAATKAGKAFDLLADLAGDSVTVGDVEVAA
jgi:antirestriction protein ArdC